MNGRAITLRGMKYRTLGRRQLRSHCRVYHAFDDVPPLAIDPGRPGVAH